MLANGSYVYLEPKKRLSGALNAGCDAVAAMAAYVYILRCADGSLYTGWTVDLAKRIAAHQAGTASRYTRSRLPVDLFASLEVGDRGAALREEARVKALTRADKLALAKSWTRPAEAV